MSDCDNFVIWRKIAAGARLRASATGDTASFDVVVRISCDDGSVTVWKRSQLVPGPASTDLPAPEQTCTVTATVSIFNDTDVELKLEIDDGKHDCSWSFHAAGGYQIEVEIIP